MKVMSCEISLPEGIALKMVRKPSEISIETSYKQLIARAQFTVARNILFFENHNVRDVFKHGAPVQISFGYNGQLVNEFSGYITEVSADHPIVVKCQDEMWKIRRIPVNYNAKTAISLASLLADIIPGYSIDALEGVNLGAIRFSKTNAGAVLDKIRSETGLYSYMSGKTLVCGKYYSDNTSDKIEVLDLDTYCADNSLEFRNSEDVISLVKGNAVVQGVKMEHQIGEEGGDTYNFTYTASSIDVLKSRVNADYNKIKRGGYNGNVSAFGTPFFKHGRKVKLVSRIYPERQGIYYIDSVGKKYDSSGIRQTLTLGAKA